MESFIVGRNATKERMRTAIVASRPLSPGSWKKTNSPMTPSISMGRKMLRMGMPGNLQMGMRKCAYWQCLISSPTIQECGLIAFSWGCSLFYVMKQVMGWKGYLLLLVNVASMQQLAILQLPKMGSSPCPSTSTQVLVLSMQLNLKLILGPFCLRRWTACTAIDMCMSSVQKGVRNTFPFKFVQNLSLTTKCMILSFQSSIMTMPLSSRSSMDSPWLNSSRMDFFAYYPTNYSMMSRSMLPQQKEKRRVPEMTASMSTALTLSIYLRRSRTQQGKQQARESLGAETSRVTSLVEKGGRVRVASVRSFRSDWLMEGWIINQCNLDSGGGGNRRKKGYIGVKCIKSMEVGRWE